MQPIIHPELWTEDRLFFYPSPKACTHFTNQVNIALDFKTDQLAQVLQGSSARLYLPNYMYSGDKYYHLSVSDGTRKKDKAVQRQNAMAIANKIDQALQEGKIILFRTHHLTQGGMGGIDLFTTDIGVTSDNIQAVKTQAKEYDLHAEEIKIGRVPFMLEVHNPHCAGMR